MWINLAGQCLFKVSQYFVKDLVESLSGPRITPESNFQLPVICLIIVNLISKAQGTVKKFKIHPS